MGKQFTIANKYILRDLDPNSILKEPVTGGEASEFLEAPTETVVCNVNILIKKAFS